MGNEQCVHHRSLHWQKRFRNPGGERVRSWHALSVSVSAVLAVAGLVAEGAEPQAASQSTAESSSDTSVTPLDTIVVTGSRIRTAGFDAPTPTTVVGEV